MTNLFLPPFTKETFNKQDEVGKDFLMKFTNIFALIYKNTTLYATFQNINVIKYTTN